MSEHDNLVKLDAQLVCELRVDCPEQIVVGDNDWGWLRVIPIIGGHFHGMINGTVVPGGADWNLGVNGCNRETVTSATVFAKYLLKTDDGVYIAIENLGYESRVNPDPVIHTNPSFHAPRGKYEWLNYGVYVGSLDSAIVDGVDGVNIKIYRML